MSRRHGRSLGINLGVERDKICSWGCIYCQCGTGERREMRGSDPRPTRERVSRELGAALSKLEGLDSVTFAGNSEPGAHPEFLEIVGDVLRTREAMGASWIVNCLSNGSELEREPVVRACDLLDEVWIKLDCGSDELFRRLNRPLARIGGVADHVRRIRRLRAPGIQSLFWVSAAGQRSANWTGENRSALVEAYAAIRPFEIHLTTVDRDPAWRGALPVPAGELEGFAESLRAQGHAARAFPANR